MKRVFMMIQLALANITYQLFDSAMKIFKTDIIQVCLNSLWIEQNRYVFLFILFFWCNM